MQKQLFRIFNPSQPVNSLHMNKLRQIYFEPEPDFWLVLVSDHLSLLKLFYLEVLQSLVLPLANKVKENTSSLEYIEEDVQDNVYDAVLKQLYQMYRLFWGTFTSTLEKSGLDELKTQLENFFNAVGCWKVSFVLVNGVIFSTLKQ